MTSVQLIGEIFAGIIIIPASGYFIGKMLLETVLEVLNEE